MDYRWDVPEGNPVLAALLDRRSLRFGFDEREVDRATLERILACGLAAPSSKNAQPWRFHVVNNRPQIDRLATMVNDAPDPDEYVPHNPRTGRPYPQYRSTVRNSAAVLTDVPATIWIENLGAFSDGRRTLLTVPHEALAGSLQGFAFEMIGIGAAIENMWVAANTLGLGAVFMGDVVVAESRIREELSLEGDLVGVLALGYSNATAVPPMDARSFADQDRIEWHPSTPSEVLPRDGS